MEDTSQDQGDTGGKSTEPSLELRDQFSAEILEAKLEIVEEIRRVHSAVALWKAFLLGVFAAIIGTLIYEQSKSYFSFELVFGTIPHDERQQ